MFGHVIEGQLLMSCLVEHLWLPACIPIHINNEEAEIPAKPARFVQRKHNGQSKHAQQLRLCNTYGWFKSGSTYPSRSTSPSSVPRCTSGPSADFCNQVSLCLFHRNGRYDRAAYGLRGSRVGEASHPGPVFSERLRLRALNSERRMPTAHTDAL